MKGLRLYLIVCGILVTGYIVVQFNQPKRIDWSDTLINHDKIPFGTYILRNRLADLFPNAKIKDYREPIYNVIVDDSAKNSSYFIVCPQLQISEVDYTKLTNYISKGNDVFIAAMQFDKVFAKHLHISTDIIGTLKNDTPAIHFTSPYLHPDKVYPVDKGCTVMYFDDFDAKKATVLSEDNNKNPDYLRFKFGKGSLYLMANPNMLTNYSLLTQQGAAYAATALSFVKDTRNIIWDEYYSQGDIDQDSPMRVFLNNLYLRWAYYIALFSLLVYVLYEIKRRQRIIPVLDPMTNTTLEFVNVVGQLYYEKRNNANIAHKQVNYILNHLRDEYQVKASPGENEFLEKLTGKLGFDETFAGNFSRYLQFISVQDRVSDTELINLNKLIEQFYLRSR
jgi:hypothetical protein